MFRRAKRKTRQIKKRDEETENERVTARQQEGTLTGRTDGGELPDKWRAWLKQLEVTNDEVDQNASVIRDVMLARETLKKQEPPKEQIAPLELKRFQCQIETKAFEIPDFVFGLHAKAVYGFAVGNEGDLCFGEGDIIYDILPREGKNWWTGRCSSRFGRFPKDYIGPLQAKIIYEFQAKIRGDLNLTEKRGFVTNIKPDLTKNWWGGEHKGRTGKFPFNYLDVGRVQKVHSSLSLSKIPSLTIEQKKTQQQKPPSQQQPQFGRSSSPRGPPPPTPPRGPRGPSSFLSPPPSTSSSSVFSSHSSPSSPSSPSLAPPVPSRPRSRSPTPSSSPSLPPRPRPRSSTIGHPSTPSPFSSPSLPPRGGRGGERGRGRGSLPLAPAGGRGRGSLPLAPAGGRGRGALPAAPAGRGRGGGRGALPTVPGRGRGGGGGRGGLPTPTKEFDGRPLPGLPPGCFIVKGTRVDLTLHPTDPPPPPGPIPKRAREDDPHLIWEVTKELGKGATATVYHATHISTQKQMAVKCMELEIEPKPNVFIQEVRLMSQCTHPGIVQYVDCLLFEDALWVAMELVDGEPLTNLIEFAHEHREEAIKPSQQLIQYTGDCLLGAFEYLHSKNIIHRDIKSDNVLVRWQDGVVKLMDFGFGCQLTPQENKRNSVVGTSFWMAPEVIQRQEYAEKPDIWSFGALLYEFVEGEPPYFKESAMKAMFSICKKGMAPVSPSSTKLFPPQDFQTIMTVINKCCAVDPHCRPTAKEMRQWNFFKDERRRVEKGGIPPTLPLIRAYRALQKE